MNSKNLSYIRFAVKTLLTVMIIFQLTGCNGGKNNNSNTTNIDSNTSIDNNATDNTTANNETDSGEGWGGNTGAPDNPYIRDDNYSIIWNNSQGFISGTLENANVKIYDIENYDFTFDNGSLPIYLANTTNGSTITASGIIPIADTLENERIYIVELSGGKDMLTDINDEINADNFILNNGTIRLAMNGFELKNIGFKVNILTELTYQIAKTAYRHDNISSFTAKSDEAAQCLLGKEINYDGVINTLDIISWIPTVNKESLNHNYALYYAAIADRVHNNISIYGDAMTLYKTPLFSKDIIYFRDDTTINSTIGKLGFVCGADFTNYNIIGANSAYFTIDKDKNIKLSAALPYPGTYEIEIDMSNSDNEHAGANLTVKMVNSSVPMLVNSNFTNIITDNIQNGYELGRAVYINSPTSIAGVYLDGFGSENFDIDKNGYVSIAQNHNIKREDGVYNLQVFAVNDYGISLPADISIRVYTQEELSPKLKDTYIDINSAELSAGKIIGTINQNITVFCPVTLFVLSDNATFGIYPNGNVYINNTPSQENYTISAYAKSECGDSNSVLLTIDKGNKILCEISTYYAKGAALSSDNKIIYMADGRSGLKIINIANATNPYIMGSIDTYDANHIALLANNKIAFIADGKYGLKIIDISNSSNPTVIGSIQTIYAQKIVLSHDNTKAYIADGNGGLKIINISNPSNPTLTGSTDEYGIYDIALSKDGTKIYAASGFGGLRVIDISNFSNPFHTSSLRTTYARGVTAISDNIIYVADSGGGLKIIDISDAANPDIVGELKTSNAYKAITLSNNQKVFLADSEGGLKIIDISDPMQPYILSSVVTSDAKDVIISKDNTKIIVIDGTGGLKIIDI
ncbi:MAG: hypothetical protein LBB59_06340 [Campylobacteraceae bacterium]|nr:hypothetical protein [Campylobacteraceae bacterium]